MAALKSSPASSSRARAAVLSTTTTAMWPLPKLTSSAGAARRISTAFSPAADGAIAPLFALTARRRAQNTSSSVVTRALTASADPVVGEAAPYFELPDAVSGKVVKLTDLKGAPATLIMFICNHCPYVVHLKAAIVALAKEYQAKGVAVVAISPNSVQTHPQDGPEKMAEDARAQGYTFPYLYDETQEVAKAYKAACTPEFYVYDKDHKLAYHGQFDDSRPRVEVPKPITGADLRAALDAVLGGQPLPKSRPSIGCNIKWHPGKEPEYYGAQLVKK